LSLPDFNLISAYGRRERPQMSKFTSPEVDSPARDRMEKTIPQSFLVLKNPGECRLILLIFNWCHPATEVLKKHLSSVRLSFVNGSKGGMEFRVIKLRIM
jgi:hypothetical protein